LNLVACVRVYRCFQIKSHNVDACIYRKTAIELHGKLNSEQDWLLWFFQNVCNRNCECEVTMYDMLN